MGERRGSHRKARRPGRPRYSPSRLKLRSRIEALLDQPFPIRWPGWIAAARARYGLAS